MATLDDYDTRVSTVVVHILDGDEVKIRHFDSMVSIDTDLTLELRGKKKYLEIEATTLEEAYSKLITHLTERAVKAEEKVKELEKAQKSSPVVNSLVLEKEALIDENEDLKSELRGKEHHIAKLNLERVNLRHKIKDALDG